MQVHTEYMNCQLDTTYLSLVFMCLLSQTRKVDVNIVQYS